MPTHSSPPKKYTEKSFKSYVSSYFLSFLFCYRVWYHPSFDAIGKLHHALRAHVGDFGVTLCRCTLNLVSFFVSIMPASANQAFIFFLLFSPLFDICSDLHLTILIMFRVYNELFLLIYPFLRRFSKDPLFEAGFVLVVLVSCNNSCFVYGNPFVLKSFPSSKILLYKIKNVHV